MTVNLSSVIRGFLALSHGIDEFRYIEIDEVTADDRQAVGELPATRPSPDINDSVFFLVMYFIANRQTMVCIRNLIARTTPSTGQRNM